MQKNITQNYLRSFCKVSLMVFAMTAFLFGKMNAQTYVNGNLSTGATSSNGTAAPAGFTWSEVQTGNTNAGFSASITNNFRLGDDFVVPAGPNWSVSKITFYGYQTNYAGTTSPFNNVRVQIHSGSITGPVVFGDLTTNRLAASTTASMYRIFNATPGTTRQIWAIEANVSVSLAPGTYWIEYQTDVIGGVGHFLPGSTVVGTATQPGNNGQQWTGTAWTPLLDGTNAQDMPFTVSYSTSACSGTPAPGNTITSAATGCSGVPFTVSVQNPTSGAGITYQWQTAPTTAGPFTNITGATNATYTSTITTTAAYQLAVTCSGNTGTSTPVLVSLTPANQCYCIPATTDCTDGDIINNVTLLTLNNSSACGTNGYTNYSTNPAINVPNLVQGASIPVSVNAGDGRFTETVGVWVDYNQNALFEASEFVYLGTTTGGTLTQNLQVPANATLGLTRMRVRVRFATALVGTASCLTYTYGETEDYAVNIVPCVQGAITTQPVNRSVNCNDATTFAVTATGSLLAYQWQTRTNATSPWTTVTNGGVYSGATTSTLSLSNIPQTLNGRQYRVLFSGPCTAIDYSTVATLTVGPLVATANPTSAAICAGGAPVMIQVTNQGAPPATTTFTSGTINLGIPDNVTTGVTSTIPVSIPAGSIITGVAVRLNMPHTWVGDMVFALRAPNGQILNLDWYLNGTGGAGVTTGMVNTVISSTGTLRFPGAGNPFTATYAADAAAGTVAAPAGPTGFIPTTNQWTALYTTPSGNWTLGMYDGGAGDIGTLTNWSLDITYAAPATGTFTPATGLFTNAAGTIPYVAGTPVSTVYAAPATTTTYQLVVANAICTSAPLPITVTVSNPVSGVTVESDFAACANGSSSITATVANGNNLNYQWQVSTDGGTTWTNISNGGIYSGANTATLTVSGVSTLEDGYQYRVVASNTCNNATSNASILTVNPNPVIVVSANPYTRLLPNLTTTLSAAVSPNTASTYTWYYNGVPVTNATGSTLNVNIDQLGDYYVDVNDINGCNSRSATITIADSSSTILFIYPSPNTGQFQVRYQSAAGNSVIPRMMNIYDSKGSRVYTRSYPINVPYTRMDVDMRKYGKGIYMVELADRNGKRIATGRVVIF